MTRWPRSLVLALIALAAALPAARAPQAPAAAPLDRAAHQRQQTDAEVKRRFEQAAAMLHLQQYEHATVALHRVLQLAPRLPEAHLNMGYALLGLRRSDEARGFFEAALALRPGQANAYYGLALAAEAQGDLETALGAMRSYLHLGAAQDRHRSRARAAIWEWEQRLRRH